MKKNLFATIILCMMATLSTKAQVYVLDDAAERSFSTISSTEYSLDGRPADQLTFEAKKSSIGANNFHVDEYYDGAWHKIADPGLSSSWKSWGPYALNRETTKIKFYTTAGATLSKYIRNVKVTMASYLESNTTSLTMPTTEIGTATILHN